MKNYSVFKLLLCMVFFQNACFGQYPVNIFSTTSTVVVPGGTLNQTVRAHGGAVNTILPNTNYNVKYNNNGNVNIIDFTLSGHTYVRFSNFDTVILRRMANTWEPTGGNKQQIYAQGNALVDNLTFSMPFPVAWPVVTNHAYMERVMEEGYINRGSDNVFNNDSTSDRTFNNIERVDFVFKAGVLTTDTSKAGFLIAERGGNDPFKIVAITGIDSHGNPTSFGPVLSVNTSHYGNTIINISTYVMRKDPADNALRPFSLVSLQNVKAVFIKLTNLGVTPSQRIYGYSLMAGDVTAVTSAQVLDYTNATYYPRNTTTSTGGMDLAAAPGIFHTDLILAGRYLTVSTKRSEDGQIVKWSDKEHNLTKEYQIEKSLDREHYTTIGVVAASQSPDYTFTDRNFTSTGYYRLKVIMNDGTSYYSAILFAVNNSAGGKVTIYPNPVKDQFSVTFPSDMRFTQIEILSATGKMFFKSDVQGNQQIKADISNLPAGYYVVRLTDDNNGQRTYPIIKL